MSINFDIFSKTLAKKLAFLLKSAKNVWVHSGYRPNILWVHFGYLSDFGYLSKNAVSIEMSGAPPDLPLKGSKFPYALNFYFGQNQDFGIFTEISPCRN